MTNIVKLYPNNAAENPDNVLEQAIGEYKEILILGGDEENDFIARASTNISHSDILWMIEYFKHKLLDGDYQD